jgi:hypothetical protein
VQLVAGYQRSTIKRLDTKRAEEASNDDLAIDVARARRNEEWDGALVVAKTAEKPLARSATAR